MVRAAMMMVSALLAGAAEAQTVQAASGTFDVNISAPPRTADGIDRRTLAKRFHGQLDGASAGQMMSAGDPARGEAGYVALEVFTGTLAGRSGGFALQHSGTMAAGGQQLDIRIVPGSGSGALAGISGRMAIRIEKGVHHYTLDYALPASP